MDHPYATIGTNDPARSRRFYDAVLGTIGWGAHATFGDWTAYSAGGSGAGFILWVAVPFDGRAATVGNGTMVGFPARSRADVDAFHAAALAQGGSDEGTPGPRDIYGPKWYAAYVRDPSGNKIAVYVNS